MTANADLDAQVLELDREREQMLLPPEYSEDALALRYAALHKGDLRYIAAWGQMVFVG